MLNLNHHISSGPRRRECGANCFIRNPKKESETTHRGKMQLDVGMLICKVCIRTDKLGYLHFDTEKCLVILKIIDQIRNRLEDSLNFEITWVLRVRVQVGHTASSTEKGTFQSVVFIRLLGCRSWDL